MESVNTTIACLLGSTASTLEACDRLHNTYANKKRITQMARNDKVLNLKVYISREH